MLLVVSKGWPQQVNPGKDPKETYCGDAFVFCVGAWVHVRFWVSPRNPGWGTLLSIHIRTLILRITLVCIRLLILVVWALLIFLIIRLIISLLISLLINQLPRRLLRFYVIRIILCVLVLILLLIMFVKHLYI